MKAENKITIAVKSLSKEYRVAQSNSVTRTSEKSFFALKDVSFSLCKGDVTGIIGSNGSGKTTLLKILSQIIKPSSGEAQIQGSVSSILEIGNNFHPDLTGRENVAIQLKLANINRKDAAVLYEKISRFSEIEAFFDQPVKFYSSGMFLRLAFSLAFHLASDILILDEVLSVGDEGFRLKCQELLRTFAEGDKTILFVSHNRSEILEFSNKCIWLDKGSIRNMGNPSKILSEYFAMNREKFEAQKSENAVGSSQLHPGQNNGALNLIWNEHEAPGNDILTVHRLSVSSISESKTMYNTEPILINFLIHKKKTGMQIGAFFFLQDVFYQPVMVGHFLNNSSDRDLSKELKNETGMVEINCTIPPNFLAPGKYYLRALFGMEENDWSPASKQAFRFPNELHFTVNPKPGYVDVIGDISKGSVRPPLEWKVQKVG